MNMNMSFIYGECHENVNIPTCWTVLDANRVFFSNISVGKSVLLTFFYSTLIGTMKGHSNIQC